MGEITPVPQRQAASGSGIRLAPKWVRWCGNSLFYRKCRCRLPQLCLHLQFWRQAAPLALNVLAHFCTITLHIVFARVFCLSPNATMSDILDWDLLSEYFCEASLDQKYYILDSPLDSFLIADLIISRGVWVDQFLAERNSKGEYARLFPDLLKDDDKFFCYFRMTKSTFFLVLNKIRSRIEKQNTKYREAISPEERLMITLRYDL